VYVWGLCWMTAKADFISCTSRTCTRKGALERRVVREPGSFLRRSAILPNSTLEPVVLDTYSL
jgi:hypothetical protein